MIFYSNGVEVVDFKEGKKKDGSPWYYVKFGDSNGNLSAFCSSEVYSKLKKGSIYSFTVEFFYSRFKKGLNLLVKECEPYVN